MYRAALRSPPSALRALRPAHVASGSRRFLSTAPAQRKGTWKGAGLRWGLAIAAVYFYNTSPIFADELPPQSRPAPSSFSDADLPTVDAIIEEKRKQTPARGPPQPREQAPEPADKTEIREAEAAHVAVPEAGPAEALEQEAESQGAFDPETGEINWDCPCLGGMAHGPCGEEFKAAFSCFVYSKEEPKGMDCIDKFQHMQDCFRKYPEIYGSEIADDEEGEASAPAHDAALAKDASEAPIPTENTATEPEAAVVAKDSAPTSKVEDPVQKLKEDAEKAADEAVPKKAHDATDANKGKKE